MWFLRPQNAPKSKFSGAPSRTPLGELTVLSIPSSWWGGARCCLQTTLAPSPPSPETTFPPSRPFGPRFYGSQGLTHYRVDNPRVTRLMIDFKCRPIWSSYFSLSENGKNWLGDEGADGAMPSPRIFGIEPPLVTRTHTFWELRVVSHSYSVPLLCCNIYHMHSSLRQRSDQGRNRIVGLATVSVDRLWMSLCALIWCVSISAGFCIDLSRCVYWSSDKTSVQSVQSLRDRPPVIDPVYHDLTRPFTRRVPRHIQLNVTESSIRRPGHV